VISAVSGRIRGGEEAWMPAFAGMTEEEKRGAAAIQSGWFKP